MKKNLLIAFVFAIVSYRSATAQCSMPMGMLAIPFNQNGNCFMTIKFAIPNSTVTITNANGYVAEGMADAAGKLIINYPCAGNPITGITSIITSPVYQICSTFMIPGGTILPVNLVSFSGSLSLQKTVLLKWETSLEIDNEKFEIERSSDGANYTRLATINSDGSGLNNNVYSFEDVSFAKGSTAIYRLKQIDYDGKASYSKIVYINDQSSSTSYSLFPNPVSNGVTNFSIKGLPTNELVYKNILITDLMGRNVSYKINGSSSIELDPSLSSGIYFVKIKEKVIKLLKN